MFPAHIFILNQNHVQDFNPDLLYFDRMWYKQGINLEASGCKIATIEVHFGDLDISISTKKYIA